MAGLEDFTRHLARALARLREEALHETLAAAEAEDAVLLHRAHAAAHADAPHSDDDDDDASETSSHRAPPWLEPLFTRRRAELETALVTKFARPWTAARLQVEAAAAAAAAAWERSHRTEARRRDVESAHALSTSRRASSVAARHLRQSFRAHTEQALRATREKLESELNLARADAASAKAATLEMEDKFRVAAERLSECLSKKAEESQCRITAESQLRDLECRLGQVESRAREASDAEASVRSRWCAAEEVLRSMRSRLSTEELLRLTAEERQRTLELRL